MLGITVLAVGALGSPLPAAAADSCPNAAIRAQQHSTHLPDCRAYEQVSPIDKNSNPVYFFPVPQAPVFGVTAAAPDGDAVVYTALTPFSNAAHGVLQTQHSHRTSTGWATTPASPIPTVPNPRFFGSGGQAEWRGASRDLSVGVTTTTNQLAPGDTNTGDIGVASDIYTLDPNGTPSLMSADNEGVAAGKGGSDFSFVISDDGESVLFETATDLLPEDDNGRFDLYERRGGITRLVGVAQSGEQASECGSSLGGADAFNSSVVDVSPASRVSGDGDRIVFQTPSSEDVCGSDEQVRIYARIDGERTLEVSASRRTPVDPGGPKGAYFVSMSRDGKRILFTSQEMLTDDTPPVEGGTSALYEYRTDTEQLTYIDLGPLSPTVIEVSPDARIVYFVSSAALTPGATEWADNLYVLRDGEVRWIGADPTGSATLKFDLVGRGPDSVRTTTPDGRSFLFRTKADMGVGNSGGRQQLYLHRAGEPLVCVSCPPSSVTPTADAHAEVGNGRLGAGTPRRRFAGPMPDDGSRALFDTAEALSPADTNGRADVYEWRDGEVSLLSSGGDGGAAYAVAMSSDGRDAFIASTAPLVSGDVDGGDLDIYNVRADGGFLEDARDVVSPCSGDACQGAPGPAPDRRPLASGLLENGGGRTAARPVLRVTPLSTGALAKVARTGLLRLRVGMTAPGRVRATASARLGERGGRRAVGSGGITLSKGGAGNLRLRLVRPAMRRLQTVGRLRLEVRVRAAGAEPRVVALVLRRPER